MSSYRGRLAPSPTGFLHLGHARTFLVAAKRANHFGGELIFRNEDLDPDRCRPEYVSAMYDDLRWIGLQWTEGPDCGGPYTPYSQSQRRDLYLKTWKALRDAGSLYPCTCSRKELAMAATAPNDIDDEPIYPGKCRERGDAGSFDSPASVNWRFRVPDGDKISFDDQHLGPQTFVAGHDFGDFVVWRRDDVPAYQLAVVADDHAMKITEAVRGADLLKFTARQLLLYRALGLAAPEFYHCDLVRDEAGVRLAKRHDATQHPLLAPERVYSRAGARTRAATVSGVSVGSSNPVTNQHEGNFPPASPIELKPNRAGEFTMATNPKLPDYPDIPPRKPADDHTKVRMIRQSKFPWSVVAIIIGAALIIAVIGFFPKGPRKVTAPSGEQIPPQPTASQVEFTGVQIEPSTVGDAVTLNAILHNAGDTAITGVEVGAQFLGANGQPVGTTMGKVQAVYGGTSSEDLTQAPIKPNDSRPVRISFDHTPKGWNHQMPALTVTTVTATTP